MLVSWFEFNILKLSLFVYARLTLINKSATYKNLEISILNVKEIEELDRVIIEK